MPKMPKRIFYVWLGFQKPADVLMAVDQWRRALPDYEIIELGEHSEKYFDFAAELKNNAWFKTVYEKKFGLMPQTIFAAKCFMIMAEFIWTQTSPLSNHLMICWMSRHL